MTPRPSSRSFYRPCWVEINTGALRANLYALQKRLKKDVQILAVVKADGYGHGHLTAAKEALAAGAIFLGVSSLDEGVALREGGITAPILILGSLFPFDHFSLLFDLKLTPTVASVEAAEALQKLAADRNEKIAVHLKVDSGFGRIGVSVSSALDFIRDVGRMPGLVIEGLYTHFASSDVDPEYTQMQTEAFQSVVGAAAVEGIRPRLIHMANSSAIIRFPETHGTLVRPGLAMYGVPPFAGADREIALDPVLTWKTRIIFLKTVPQGASISYARTWIAKRPTRVATLAVGYADGLPRLLSNQGQVLAGGTRVPILGRVTMDMTMIDVTDLNECHVGDEVILIGRQGNETMSAQEMADAAQTSAYEILCGIGPRVSRQVVESQNG